MIRRLDHHEIDFEKYTECIEKSVQKNMYARREILDFWCESWDILVWKDYEYVMPLPLTKKFSQKFVTCPIFCQQLGIFGSEDSIEINGRFLSYMQANLDIYLYSFNAGNHFQRDLSFRKNYFIPSGSFADQKRIFSKGRKSAIKSATHLNFDLTVLDAAILEFINRFYKGLSKEKDKKMLLDYLQFLHSKEMLKVCSASLHGELRTVALMADDGETLYLIGLVSDEKFRIENPTSFIIDQILQHHLEKRNFSFMGSNVRNIEIFNKSFGAELKEYPVIQHSKKEVLIQFLKNKLS
ncbi:MAG: hypothetical protein K0M63_04335 [Weeksellaceae bacterium]|nr:hypothetical protein [Weeksellaceae bacterium]